MRVIKKSMLILFTLSMSLGVVHSQTIHVEKISITEGLSSGSLRQTMQDSYGLIWIATDDGLNVYDGYGVKVYKNIPGNPRSILSNNIWSIKEDEGGNIWIATEEGVSRHIREENQFVNYETGDMVKANFVSQSRITYLYIDSRDEVWVSTITNDFLRYNRKSDSWDKPEILLSDSTYFNPTPRVAYPIIEDSKGKIWAGSHAFGLIYFDSNEEVFKQAEIIRKKYTPNFTEAGKELTCLYFDEKNILWLTTRSGVYKYYPETKELKTIKEYSGFELTFFAYYNGITQDKQGNIWISNNFRGILKFDGISDNYSVIKVQGVGSYSDGRSEILYSDVMLDNTGLLWFSTSLAGIYKYNPYAEPFYHYKHDPTQNNSINSSQIFGLAESKKYPGKIYVGTRGGGLNLFDPTSKTFTNIPFKVIKDAFGGSV